MARPITISFRHLSEWVREWPLRGEIHHPSDAYPRLGHIFDTYRSGRFRLLHLAHDCLS